MRTDKAFRLVRIIFVDSYCENAIEEIRLPGHLSLTGDNGAGKTTLLRVIPVFFGEAPNRVIRKEGDQEGFVKHYLPRISAYIVFEYERHGALMLAVMHTAAGPEKATYQFIDSPYRQEFFVLPDQSFVHAGKLKQHVESMGVSVSERLSHEGYRQVIQNSPTRENSKLAARFAFSNKSRGLQHVERIMTAVLQRETSFFDLKRMIISSVRGSEDAFRLHLDRNALVRWVDECEAYLDIMSYKEKVVVLGDKDLERVRLVGDLKTLFREFQALKQHLVGEEHTVVELQESEISHRDRRLGELDEEIGQIRTQFEEASAKSAAATKLAKKLELERKQYEDDGIDDKQRRVAQIPTLKGQLDGCDEQLATLGDTQRPILQKFEEIELVINDETQAELNRLPAKKNQIIEESGSQSLRVREAYDVATQELEGLQREQIDALNESVIVATAAEAAAKATTPAAEPSLLEALIISRQHHQTCQQTQTNAAKDQGDAEKAHRSALAAYLDADGKVQQALQRVESIDSDLSRWYSFQTPGEDTLLAFLRQHNPEWSRDIGKLINERVLLRTDLSPTLSEGDSFYGLTLAVDRIEREGFSDEQEIAQEIATLLERRNAAELSVGEFRDQAVRAGENAQTKEKLKEAADLYLAEAKVAEVNARRQVDELESLVRKSLEDARKLIADEIASATTQLKTARQNQGQAAFRHKQSRDELLADYQRKVKAIDSAKASALKTLNQEREAIEGRHSERRAQCAKDRDQALAEKGISPQLLKRLSDERASVAKQLQTAQGFEPEVQAYQSWLKTVWPQHEDHLGVAKREGLVAQSKKTDLNSREDAKRSYSSEVARRLKQLDERLNGVRTQQRTIDTYLEDMAPWSSPEGAEPLSWQPTMIFESLLHRQKDAKRGLREVEVDIRDGVEDIRTALGKYPGTTIGQFYRQLVNAHGVPRSGCEFEWIPPLRGWFLDDHTQTLNGLLQQGRGMAQSVDEFRKQLADFEQHVRNFHRDLQSSLDGNVCFSRIRRVQVRIRTRLDDQDYWNAVNLLSSEYSDWVARGTVALPEQPFMDAARRMANILREGKGLITEPADLVDLEVEADIEGKDRPVLAKTEQQLARLSSTGLSYLILCMVLIGFLKRIIREAPVELIWPVDELRDLDLHNTRALVDTLTQNGITLASAFPDPDPEILSMFDNRYHVRADRRIYEVALQEVDHV